MGFPEWLYTIDILFIVLVIFFAAGGLRRGLSGELAHMLTLLIMLCVVCFFYPAMLRGTIHRWPFVPVAVVQISLIVSLIMSALLFFFLLRAVLKRLFKAGLDVPLDHLTGLFAGALRGAVTGVALMAALSLLAGEKVHLALSERSVVGNWVCTRLTPWLQPRLMELPVFDRGEAARPSA